ncbi:hypothetical protein LT85_2229 [Collimonas arenae]|uniref:Uncharacterized protein n=1 Tax=Collimonas arenae TaxID=279058 RepID=A0A0A1FEX2_9BURK|nr:hypothetical protein LT85_2229 [Collimonas arenae]
MRLVVASLRAEILLRSCFCITKWSRSDPSSEFAARRSVLKLSGIVCLDSCKSGNEYLALGQ